MNDPIFHRKKIAEMHFFEKKNLRKPLKIFKTVKKFKSQLYASNKVATGLASYFFLVTMPYSMTFKQYVYK
jgi:hypothetical protein